MTPDQRELLKRLRLGAVRKLCQLRYRSVILPDDDSGRDDLEIMLCLSADKNHANVIEVSAPWIDPTEADKMIAFVQSLPPNVRWLTPKALGARLRYTAEDWERYRLRQIVPYDITEEELIERRKRRKREAARRRRQRIPRHVYESNSLSKLKPWEALGIKRRAYFYRLAKRHCTSVSSYRNQHCTGVSPINILSRHTPVQRGKRASAEPQGAAQRASEPQEHSTAKPKKDNSASGHSGATGAARGAVAGPAFTSSKRKEHRA